MDIVVALLYLKPVFKANCPILNVCIVASLHGLVTGDWTEIQFKYSAKPC